MSTRQLKQFCIMVSFIFISTFWWNGPLPGIRSAGAQLGGGIKRALECGTIGNIGVNRCKDQKAEPPHSCTNGGSDGSNKELEDPLRDALRSSGFEARVDSVYVHKKNGMTCFQIRLGKNHQPLPSLACIERRIRSGEVKDGSVEGAKTMLVGCIQQVGNRTRTTVREIDVETGEVLRTGKGDAQGTDMPAIRKSVKDAFRNMVGAGKIS